MEAQSLLQASTLVLGAHSSRWTPSVPHALAEAMDWW
jgi:hypothetical protein